MSDEHSNVDKKSGKKGSGSGSDFKPPHKKSKDFQVHYETKGNEKGPKDQSSGSKGNPPHQDDQHASHGSNKPKSYTKNRKESANNPSGALKRKHPKVSKDIILDFYAKAPIAQEVDELIASCAQLFVKDKQNPVNQEDNQLDPNEGLVPKNAYAPTTASGSTTSTTATSLTSLSGATASTTTSSNAPTTSSLPANQNVSTTAPPTTATTESKPTTQAQTAASSTTATTTAAPANTSGTLDPIQAMREKMKRDKAAKEQQKAAAAAAAQGEDANKRKDSEQEKKVETPQKEEEERKLQSVVPQEPVQDKEEGNDEKYSDIDEMYEQKLKSKAGEEAKNAGTGEENNRALDEDNQRPEWENVDAGQVVREIGKDEFMTSLSQDKRTIFGDKYVEKDRLGNTASGVDFSKVSFDNETKNRMNDNFNIPSADMYGGRGGMQQGMPQEYYNPQDAGQSNMYRGAQGQSMQQQQGTSLYVNKSYNANQAAPVTPTSAKQTAQVAYPSVIFKYFSPNYDAKVWSYIDLEDKLQGPFSGRTMDEWYSKGYLPFELNVTIGKNSGFRGLKELAEIIINHNTQETAQQPEKPVQKIPSSTALPEQQYQQQHYQQQQQYYQQQQQQPQYQSQHQQQYYQQQHHHQQQQQQQQYQPQQQYSQQQQQQQYYRQQANPQANEMQRFHSDTSSYGTNFQTTASRVKNFEGSEVSDMYYRQQQQQQGQGQYGSQQHDYHRSASAANIQNQNYYQQNYDNYYGQEPQQQKQTQSYQAYTKAGSNTNLPSSSYYQQESNVYQQGGYNQPGYSQPQKTATTQQQWKGPQQGAGAGYTGGMTPTGGGYGGQSAGFGGQGGYSGMYGGMQGGQGQGNMTYAMQQQMLNRGNSMGQGSLNMGGDMKGMQGMLGMQRPASRQQQQEEPDY